MSNVYQCLLQSLQAQLLSAMCDSLKHKFKQLMQWYKTTEQTKDSGLLGCGGGVIGWVRSYFSEDCSAFIVAWSLTMKALWSCETYGTTQPTQPYIAEGSNGKKQWLKHRKQTGQELERQVSFVHARQAHVLWRCFIACGFLVSLFLDHYCVFCPLPKSVWVVCVNYWLTSILHWGKVLSSSASN